MEANQSPALLIQLPHRDGSKSIPCTTHPAPSQRWKQINPLHYSSSSLTEMEAIAC